jgi:PqqD family protein of HPr-rel-A system
MRWFGRVEGVLVEPLGDIWVAFSPLSGETALVNTESAALLEILASGPAPEEQLYQALADDTGLTAPQVAAAIAPAWGRLIESGFVRECAPLNPL